MSLIPSSNSKFNMIIGEFVPYNLKPKAIISGLQIDIKPLIANFIKFYNWITLQGLSL